MRMHQNPLYFTLKMIVYVKKFRLILLRKQSFYRLQKATFAYYLLAWHMRSVLICTRIELLTLSN